MLNSSGLIDQATTMSYCSHKFVKRFFVFDDATVFDQGEVRDSSVREGGLSSKHRAFG
jgi:hypothetical protein